VHAQHQVALSLATSRRITTFQYGDIREQLREADNTAWAVVPREDFMIGGEDITCISMSGGVGLEQPLLGYTQYKRTVGM
jgi:hypothetical protein